MTTFTQLAATPSDPPEPHSPAEYVRRPSVPAESPILGFTHLQFEALLTAARQSPNRYDFALVAMLGLLGLRIFEATGANIADLGEEHGHRVLTRPASPGHNSGRHPASPMSGRMPGTVIRHAGSRVIDLIEHHFLVSSSAREVAGSAG